MDRESTGSDLSRAGGVLVAVSKHLNSFIITTNSTSLEQVFVGITHGSLKIIIGAVYIQPNSSSDVFSSYSSTVCDITPKYPNHQLIVLGDFNLPHIKWSVNPLQYQITSYISPAIVSGERSILECYSYLDMEQHYPNHKSKQYTLDLLFAESGTILLTDNCDQLLRTDIHHQAVLFLTNFKSPSVIDYRYRNFYKANFSVINSSLSEIDWDGLFIKCDIDDNCDKLYNILNKQINLHVPLQRNKVTSDTHWYSSDLIKLIKYKKKAHITYKQTNQIEDYIEFKSEIY